jgi:hypothetical protein|tara:strand:- start:232 stop:582 length:351 start_codon:yes stop_codon:yes gene_type:complete
VPTRTVRSAGTKRISSIHIFALLGGGGGVEIVVVVAVVAEELELELLLVGDVVVMSGEAVRAPPPTHVVGRAILCSSCDATRRDARRTMEGRGQREEGRGARAAGVHAAGRGKMER